MKERRTCVRKNYKETRELLGPRIIDAWATREINKTLWEQSQQKQKSPRKNKNEKI